MVLGFSSTGFCNTGTPVSGTRRRQAHFPEDISLSPTDPDDTGLTLSANGEAQVFGNIPWGCKDGCERGRRPPYINQKLPDSHLGLPRWLSVSRTRLPMKELQETQVQSLGQEDPLEGMAAHSSTLAWRIPWTEEPGGL